MDGNRTTLKGDKMGRKSTNKADYLTVGEFAKRVGKSSQSVYKKMKPSHSFWRYVQDFDGTRMIHKAALSEVYGVSVEGDNGYQQEISEELPTSDNLIIKTLQDRVDEQSRTIDALNKALASAQEALQNEQKLHGITQARLRLLEDKTATAADISQDQTAEHTADTAGSPSNQGDVAVGDTSDQRPGTDDGIQSNQKQSTADEDRSADPVSAVSDSGEGQPQEQRKSFLDWLKSLFTWWRDGLLLLRKHR